ncbi:MAG: heme-binding protein [Pseudomonadota bacterium]
MGVKKWIGLGLGVAALGGAVAFAQYRDIEVPSHTVVKSEDAFELRDYEPMIVAEVTHSGSRREASSRSFRRLAAYIFAQDRPEGGEKIAMTSPVLQDRVDQNAKIAMTSPVLQDETDADTWRMRFVMPSEFTMESLPTPPEDIALEEVPARRVAAVKFSGYGSAADLADMETLLTDWITDQKLVPKGDFEYAFYDAPMVPGPMRRNEVLIEVAAD